MPPTPTAPGSFNDEVWFNLGIPGPCNMNVLGLLPLQSLEITSWRDTLTVSNNLFVAGSTGDFRLTDPSTITMATGINLYLTGVGTQLPNPNNVWSAGTITGAANSSFTVTGCTLNTGSPGVPAGPFALGTDMVINGSADGKTAGFFNLQVMTSNLDLSGADNIIDVGGNGFLRLNQVIAAQGQQNSLGGIDLTPAHTGFESVQIEVGGEVDRFGIPVAGVPNQVELGGSTYNVGGTLYVASGAMLNLSGTDNVGDSYWQSANGLAMLKVDAGANLTAAGTYGIDAGTVQLQALGGAPSDELDGAGLNFSNVVPTSLNIVDAGQNTGTVIVQGSVTLAAKTGTTLNYFGANNTADQLDVQNGSLNLNGVLSLTSRDSLKPTQQLEFFDDVNSVLFPANITGAFTAISGNLLPKPTYLGSGPVQIAGSLDWLYFVSIT